MRNYQAFTLLELLISAALLVGISVLLVGTLSSVTSAYIDHSRATASGLESQAVIEQLKNELESASFVVVGSGSTSLLLASPAAISGSTITFLCYSTSNHVLKKYYYESAASMVDLTNYFSSADLPTDCDNPSTPASFTSTTLSSSNVNDQSLAVNQFIVTPVTGGTTAPQNVNPAAVQVTLVAQYTTNTVRANDQSQIPEVLRATVPLQVGATGTFRRSL